MSARYVEVGKNPLLRRLYLCRLLVWVFYPVLLGWTLWGASRNGVDLGTWVVVPGNVFVWWAVDKHLLRIISRWEIEAEVAPLNPVDDEDLYRFVVWSATQRLPGRMLRDLRSWLRQHDVLQVPSEDRPHLVNQFVDAIELIAVELKKGGGL